MLAGQHEFHGDLVWDARGAAGDEAAAEPELRFGIEEIGIVRGHGEIGELHEHIAAADAVAGDRRDDRLVEFDADARHAFPQVGVAWRVLEVGAHGEGPVARAGYDGAAVVRIPIADKRVANAGDDPVTERVQLVRAVDGDNGDTVVGLVGDEIVAHACVSIAVILERVRSAAG
jgi:hypothetical protein